ncbi:hypothetical protein ACQP1P_21430 [Dactylosporangium sp. CA-052675]|uniref:hypothetical protein n=1 Tax=Dactylosporangium sp. CA-052675 TaxID=3239927 RepID=UPI003D90F1AD
MGGIGFSIGIDGDGDVDAARVAVWEETRTFAAWFHWLGGKAYDELDHYLDGLEPAAIPHQAGARRMYLWFPNPAGSCLRSMLAWAHWCEVAVAVEWARMRYVAGQHGVTITGSQPDAAAGKERFVVVRDRLWLVEDDGLRGDNLLLPLDELTAEEAGRVEAARERCGCAVCAGVRPDPDILATVLADLHGADDDRAVQAAWFLGRMDSVPPEVLEALVRVGAQPGRFDYNDFCRALTLCADRVPGAWAQLMALAPEMGPDGRDMALQALFPSYRAPQRTADERDAYRAALRAALAEYGSDVASYLLELMER